MKGTDNTVAADKTRHDDRRWTGVGARLFLVLCVAAGAGLLSRLAGSGGGPDGIAAAQVRETPTPTRPVGLRETPTPTRPVGPRETPTPTPTLASRTGPVPPSPTPGRLGVPSFGVPPTDCLPAIADASDVFGGSPPYLWVRDVYLVDEPVPESRVYVRFDLSSIPPGSTVSSAQLHLYLDQGSLAPSENLQVRRVVQDWSEATLVWANQPWPPENKPYDTTAVSTTPGWKTWDIPTLVQGWVSGGFPNYGLVITGDLYNAGPDGLIELHTVDFERVFRSREYEGAFAPCLAVTFQAPTGPVTPGPTWTTAPTFTPIPVATVHFFDPAPWDLSIQSIEVLQTIQMWDPPSGEYATNPRVPLIADKESLVRVYVTLNGFASTQKAAVTLDAYRLGLNLAPCPGVPLVQEKMILANIGEVDVSFIDDLSKTFNFQIPASCNWLDDGDITIYAYVSHPDYPAADASSANDLMARTFQFWPMRPLHVRVWVGEYHKADGSVLFPSLDDAQFDYLRALYPISSLDWDYSAYSLVIEHDDYPYLDYDIGGDDWKDDRHALLEEFESCCVLDSVDSNVLLLHPSLTGCRGVSHRNSRVALLGSGCGATMAHEIGHDLGLPHASDAHGEAEDAGELETYYFHGWIDGRGWDPAVPLQLIRWGPPSGDPSVWHSHDNMAYGHCDDSGFQTVPDPGGSKPWYCEDWISPRNYGRLAERLRCANPQTLDEDNNEACLSDYPFNVLPVASPGSPTEHLGTGVGVRASSAGTPAAALSITQQDGGFLRVSGLIRSGAQAELQPFYQVPEAPSSARREGRGRYRLELQDSQGRVLAARNFNGSESTEHGSHELNDSFTEFLPWDPSTAQVVLSRGGQILAERAVSPNAPTVDSITVTCSAQPGASQGDERGIEVHWTAADPDGDPLAFWVQYSSADGGAWQLLRRNLRETRLNVSSLPFIEGARIQVLATDGVNTAVGTSEPISLACAEGPS